MYYIDIWFFQHPHSTPIQNNIIRVCTATLNLYPNIETRSLFQVIPSINVFASVKIVSESE